MSMTAGADTVAVVLEEDRERIEAAMKRLAAFRLEQIPQSLREPIRYALGGGGKRVRPLLCIRTYAALAGSRVPDAVYDAACAIEWIHTYSLVHDDLPCMDDDDLRRGRPTLHRLYGSEQASVAGALMIPFACAVLEKACNDMELGAREAAATVRELTAAAGAAGMVGGQVLDLAAESRRVSVAELEGIHAMKTGALFAASLRIGARLARADHVILEGVGRAGAAIGLAFQVTDDVLDETGTTTALGKHTGMDRAHHKATYPALLGLDAAVARARSAADAAVAALASAGVRDPQLERLVRFAVDRDR